MKQFRPPLFASLVFGLILTSLVYSPNILQPSFVSWLRGGDGYNHYLGWVFYRFESWAYPLAQISSYVQPLGTTLTQMDSIPILAIVFKTISPWLPTYFQYFGLWHVLCFGLQFYLGFQLLQLLTNNFYLKFIGALFFGFSPLIVYRYDHHALCAQFILLFYIYQYARLVIKGLRPQYFLSGLMLLCTLGIHPYFFAMGFGLLTPLYYISHKQKILNYTQWLIHASSYFVGTFIVAHALGYFGVSDPGDAGFGSYSTDLLQMLNGQKLNLITPHLRSAWGQYEGYSYLGLGLILLLVLSFRDVCKTLWYEYRPFFLACLAMFVFALSSHITIGGNTVLNIEFIYKWLEPIPSIFRTSGRFVWPLYYFLVFVIIRSFLNNKKYGITLFAFAFLIQIIDLSPMYFKNHFSDHNTFPLSSHYWKKIDPQLQKMILVPSVLMRRGQQCHPDGFDVDTTRALAWFAGHHKMKINSGFSARVGPDYEEVCQGFWEKLAAEPLDNKALYVVHPQYFDRFQKLSKAQQMNCQQIDTLYVCKVKNGG